MDKMFTSFLGAGVWAVIKAVLLLILAFVAAKIVKTLVLKLFSKTKANALLGKSDVSGESKERTLEFIGKLSYLLVFLLFIPGIFETLGMKEVSPPILNLLNTLWGYLPNILGAVIVLSVGFFAAKLIRELLIPVFNKLKINTLQEKAGMEVSDSAKLSNTLAYIVYALILIPVIITGLRVLDIQAISEPAIQMLDILFSFIPNILAALMIVIVGCMVAKFAGNIVKSLIASSGLDSKVAKLMDGKESKFTLSSVIGATVHTVLIIFFVVESFSVLHLQVVTNVGEAVISYMPYVLAAVLIMLACWLLNAMAQKALEKNGHGLAAFFCKCTIYTAGGFMVLNELGIAKEIVNTAFVLILAALAIAFAISFGMGSKDFAKRTVEKLEERYSKKDE